MHPVNQEKKIRKVIYAKNWGSDKHWNIWHEKLVTTFINSYEYITIFTKKYTALCFLFIEVSFMFLILFLRFLSFIFFQNNLPTWPVFTVCRAERTQARPTNKPRRPKRTKVTKVCTLSPFKGPTNWEWFLGGPSPIPWSTRKITRHYLYSVSKKCFSSFKNQRLLWIS